ncbi:MAG: hypothetical protein H6739_07045 [Alphaproteobacteria bacterium]|nr:hypothetical protein [Alphaproteobacteria bacterium]
MGMLPLLLLACAPPPVFDDPASYEGPTLITAVTPGCSVESESWSLTVETEGWTGGGLFSMSLDGLRVEGHELLSREAAPDGSWDRLVLDLDIIADPAEVQLGETTGYLCEDEGDLAFRVVVFDPDDGQKADCRVWGQALDWNAAAGYSDCDTWLE